jgi:hypothetical protein
MDDFGDEMNGVGLTFFVKETDEIEHLGDAHDYFSPISTVEPWKAAVVRLFEQSIGLLPIVRACEKLRTFGRAPSVDEIRQAAQELLADYHVRRLVREVGVRSHH